MKGQARCLALDLKMMKKLRSKKASKAQQIHSKFLTKLQRVQQRIKVCMDQSAEFNIWGFNSHIIAHVIKCRLLEDLISCAQKRSIRPDREVERELRLMEMLQRQTWEDINTFLKNRNRDRWRCWDNPRNVNYNKTNIHGFSEAAHDNQTIDFEQLQRSAEDFKVLRNYEATLSQLESEQKTHV